MFLRFARLFDQMNYHYTGKLKLYSKCHVTCLHNSYHKLIQYENHETVDNLRNGRIQRKYKYSCEIKKLSTEIKKLSTYKSMNHAALHTCEIVGHTQL